MWIEGTWGDRAAALAYLVLGALLAWHAAFAPSDRVQKLVRGSPRLTIGALLALAGVSGFVAARVTGAVLPGPIVALLVVSLLAAVIVLFFDMP